MNVCSVGANGKTIILININQYLFTEEPALLFDLERAENGRHLGG